MSRSDEGNAKPGGRSAGGAARSRSPAGNVGLAAVAELAGVRYDLPGGAGPTTEDMAAAADMTPEERMAMIEGMVAQLSDRLATEGGDVEDWERLIRSLAEFALNIFGRMATMAH